MSIYYGVQKKRGKRIIMCWRKVLKEEVEFELSLSLFKCLSIILGFSQRINRLCLYFSWIRELINKYNKYIIYFLVVNIMKKNKAE